jgi:hypothetical protein
VRTGLVQREWSKVTARLGPARFTIRNRATYEVGRSIRRVGWRAGLRCWGHTNGLLAKAPGPTDSASVRTTTGAVELVGRRWTGTGAVLHVLLTGGTRFGEIKAAVRVERPAPGRSG